MITREDARARVCEVLKKHHAGFVVVDGPPMDHFAGLIQPIRLSAENKFGLSPYVAHVVATADELLKLDVSAIDARIRNAVAVCWMALVDDNAMTEEAYKEREAKIAERNKAELEAQ